MTFHICTQFGCLDLDQELSDEDAAEIARAMAGAYEIGRDRAVVWAADAVVEGRSEAIVEAGTAVLKVAAEAAQEATQNAPSTNVVQ